MKPIRIYQGGNKPIHLTFPASISSYAYISAGIYQFDSGRTIAIKRWDRDDMIVTSDTEVDLPLSQLETSRFNSGSASLQVKMRPSGNSIEFSDDIDVNIIDRHDRYIVLGED